MGRSFDIAGPCFGDEHYMIPPERRAQAAVQLIHHGRRFSLVSGRQTGKTTVVQHLEASLSASGDRLVAWADLETARGRAEAGAMAAIVSAIERALARTTPGLTRSREEISALLEHPADALVEYLGSLCAASERPVVLLLDEADVLTGRAMVSFLTELRASYLARKQQPAPWCVVLIGVRSVRDYVTGDGADGLTWIGTASPFNVTVENVTLPDFRGRGREDRPHRRWPDAVCRARQRRCWRAEIHDVRERSEGRLNRLS